MIHHRFFFLYWLFLIIFLSRLGAVEYQVQKQEKNLVRFISKAPLDSFEGKTSVIDGYLFGKTEKLGKGAQVYFEVDLRTVHTGIGLRDRHMRDQYLETEYFPLAIFKGLLISPRVLSDSDSIFDATVEGSFEVHGIKKPLSVTGRLQKKGDLIIITTHFTIKLSDYNIKIPKLMFMKLNEEIRIQAIIFLKRTIKKE